MFHINVFERFGVSQKQNKQIKENKFGFRGRRGLRRNISSIKEYFSIFYADNLLI